MGVKDVITGPLTGGGGVLLVFTDRDNDAGGPVPVAVSVTLCDLPSQGTWTLPAPVTVTSSSRSNAVTDGAVLGGGALEVFTCRAMAAWPPVPVACSTTECSRPSQGTWMLPIPLVG